MTVTTRVAGSEVIQYKGMEPRDPFEELWDEHESSNDTIDDYDVSDYYSSEEENMLD